MGKPRIAVVSFPGNNCEVESIRAINRSGMQAVPFRWNDSHEKLAGIAGYFLPGGFSYEDRGRAGMVAARDPLFDHIAREAEAGKVVIGNCNGAQMLVESGLIPLGKHLNMSIAQNVVDGASEGFLNEWVWITPSCKRNMCATSNWQGTMQIPIAHGEGRFTTKDTNLLSELCSRDQIAFRYCNASGDISDDPSVTPNGSMYAIAGICNPLGNVVALMPHPERVQSGDPYFASLKQWIEKGRTKSAKTHRSHPQSASVVSDIPLRHSTATEIFIDTLIVNNEERTVEQTVRKCLPNISLQQLRYLSTKKEPVEILANIALFNPNKEKAFIRRGESFFYWNAVHKREEPFDTILSGAISLLRRDEPETGAAALGSGGETGICYVCRGVDRESIFAKNVLEIFANPHASTLEAIV